MTLNDRIKPKELYFVNEIYGVKESNQQAINESTDAPKIIFLFAFTLKRFTGSSA